MKSNLRRIREKKQFSYAIRFIACSYIEYNCTLKSYEDFQMKPTNWQEIDETWHNLLNWAEYNFQFN